MGLNGERGIGKCWHKGWGGGCWLSCKRKRMGGWVFLRDSSIKQFN